jgi:hypothetical protein
MFAGYPALSPDQGDVIRLGEATSVVSEMPAIAGISDWTAMVTRLRMVMEDPRQLLSGAVTDYAAQLLAANGNRPADLLVPGLDGESYRELAAG